MAFPDIILSLLLMQPVVYQDVSYSWVWAELHQHKIIRLELYTETKYSHLVLDNEADIKAFPFDPSSKLILLMQGVDVYDY